MKALSTASGAILLVFGLTGCTWPFGGDTADVDDANKRHLTISAKLAPASEAERSFIGARSFAYSGFVDSATDQAANDFPGRKMNDCFDVEKDVRPLIGTAGYVINRLYQLDSTFHGVMGNNWDGIITRTWTRVEMDELCLAAGRHIVEMGTHVAELTKDMRVVRPEIAICLSGTAEVSKYGVLGVSTYPSSGFRIVNIAQITALSTTSYDGFANYFEYMVNRGIVPPGQATTSPRNWFFQMALIHEIGHASFVDVGHHVQHTEPCVMVAMEDASSSQDISYANMCDLCWALANNGKLKWNEEGRPDTQVIHW